MATESAGAIGAGSRAQRLGMDDFLRVLLTQLTFQDPLKPMDNQQFMAQIAQFTALDQAQEVNGKLDRLLLNASVLHSAGMVGRTVMTTTADGPMSGVVSSVSVSAEGVRLEFAGPPPFSVGLDKVTSIR